MRGEAGRRPGLLSPLCPLLCDLRQITPPLWALVSLFVKGVGWIGFLSAVTHYGWFYRVKSNKASAVTILFHPHLCQYIPGTGLITLSGIEFSPHTWEGQSCIANKLGMKIRGCYLELF